MPITDPVTVKGDPSLVPPDEQRGIGDNSEAESEAFERAMRVQIGLNAERASLNAKVTKARKEMKTQGIQLAKLDRTIAMLEWSPAEIREEFDTIQRYARLAGLPIGTQVDLFANAPDDEMARTDWFARGRAAALLQRQATPPKECPPELHQDFLDGWTTVQADNAPKKMSDAA